MNPNPTQVSRENQPKSMGKSTGKNQPKTTVNTGEVTIIHYLPDGFSKEVRVLPYQGVVIIPADNGVVLVECTVDGNYARIFNDIEEFKEYLQETYGFDIEIE